MSNKFITSTLSVILFSLLLILVLPQFRVDAKPNEYQILACQDLLRGLLARQETLQINSIEILPREVEESDQGAVIIRFTANDKYDKRVDSSAFCSADDRASASIMDIQHVDHMKP